MRTAATVILIVTVLCFRYLKKHTIFNICFSVPVTGQFWFAVKQMAHTLEASSLGLGYEVTMLREIFMGFLSPFKQTLV
jgi:hypothetical protein